MADDSWLAQMLGITSQDQSTQPTAAATGTPNPNVTATDPTGQGDWPGKPAWLQGMPGVLQPSATPNARSTGDLSNWRQMYGAPKLFYDLPWNNMRTQWQAGMANINKMPWIFNPGAFSQYSTTQDLRNAIFPGAGLGENALMSLQGANQDTLQSLLDRLTPDQKSTLEKMLGVGGAQTNPSNAAGGTTTPAATSTTSTTSASTTPSSTGTAAAAQLAPWQQALSTNNDAFFGLPTNTLSSWKSSGLSHNLGVDPSTFWFFQGLSPDAQAAFMQHQSQFRPDDMGSLQSILSTWNQPPSNLSNPLGVPYPWSSGL